MSDIDAIRAAQALANGIIKAHNDAMTALAADVHPYSREAVDAHEQTIRDNLDALLAALAALLAALARRNDERLWHCTMEDNASTAWESVATRASAASARKSVPLLPPKEGTA